MWQHAHVRRAASRSITVAVHATTTPSRPVCAIRSPAAGLRHHAAIPLTRRSFASSSAASSYSTSACRSFSSTAASATAAPSAASAAAASSNPFLDPTLWGDPSDQFDTATADPAVRESGGEVIGVNKGIVTIDGVFTAHPGACVQFFQPDEPSVVVAWGLVLSIHRDYCKALILGASGEEVVTVGLAAVHQRGHVPALDPRQADEWRGGVFDALGRRLDPISLEPISPTMPQPILLPDSSAAAPASADAAAATGDATPAGHWPLLTYPCPSMTRRSTRHRFLPTGLINVDAFHPIAEGLRIGIMGPKRTGKTTLAATIMSSFTRQTLQYEDALAASEAAAASSAPAAHSTGTSASAPPALLPHPFHLIYCCVGQSRAEVNQLIGQLSQLGVLPHVTLVVALADSLMGMQYLAPFTAQTISDYYRDERRQSSLVVFDDLSAHGHVLSVINRSYGTAVTPPNFVHAKLLERSAPVVVDEASGEEATNTALVLVETHRADRSMDINENLSGAVDHTIWLDSHLASAGLYPAIACNTILGRPASRYRPLLLRSLTNSLSSILTHSAQKANALNWARAFGLQKEMEDEVEEGSHLIRFKEKMQIICKQPTNVTNATAATTATAALTLSEQYLLLHAAQWGGESAALARVDVELVELYRTELLRTIRDQSVPQLRELFAKLNAAIIRRLSRTNRAKPHEQPEQTNESPLDQLLAEYEGVLEQFTEDFERKYAQ